MLDSRAGSVSVGLMPPTTIHPKRLMSAVDAVVAVMRRLSALGGPVPHPAVLSAGPYRPEEFAGFSCAEIREAGDFLFRCGLLEWKDAP